MQNYQNLKVDLSNCDVEPIHLIGRIQPHGFLLILSQDTLAIEQVSENIEAYFGVAPEKLQGRTLGQICTPEEYHTLEIQLRNADKMNPQLLTLQGKLYFGFIHPSEDKIVVECEPYTQSTEKQRLESTFIFSEFQSKLNSLNSLEEQANLLVEYAQAILDYDRVMLYAFDPEWNGEVIAEKIKPGVTSYLHHHFPATDIPAQARALLVQKHVRQIPDANAQPLNIVPYLNPASGKPSNILRSELRNPSELHLEFLRNMNVRATLSVSVMVKGELWGLINCQNETPVLKNYWQRQTCNLVAKAFSNAILASAEKRDLVTLEKYRQAENKLMEQVHKTGNICEGLLKQQLTLLNISEGTGAALFFENELFLIGSTPSEVQVLELLAWLQENRDEQIFHTRQLSKAFPPAAAYQEQASGLLALEISRFSKSFILFFKPEIKETRIWAGNPEKPVAGADQLIHPRKSFEKWVEVVKGKSVSWSLSEIEIGQLLQKDIIAYVLRSQAARLRELNSELRTSAEELHLKNQRLEDFAHIITHNLRSPMSNIRGLYNLYQAEPDPETGAEVMKRMHVVINNMAATIDDLNLILRAALEKQLPSQPVRLLEVIEKEKQNLEAVIRETNADIQTDLEVQEITVPKVYLESILHNLLSNALKYRADNRKPVIRIKSWREQDCCCLSVSDNGLGMDLQKVGNKVFGLYKTFHANKDSKGLGLYLTKLQAEALGGKIEVTSEPDKGTTFTLKIGGKTNKEQ
ncbi:ATP-binding protein [Botryobacter ruber]|uniref:ATP-binding protein n=1 Tax=Botryobacter ruber TaxID=2171629 RepID=UPI000E0BAB0E|nr:ATP-binding protein [Botryobacter ruber]